LNCMITVMTVKEQTTISIKVASVLLTTVVNGTTLLKDYPNLFHFQKLQELHPESA
jgi:hypothetical protein